MFPNTDQHCNLSRGSVGTEDWLTCSSASAGENEQSGPEDLKEPDKGKIESSILPSDDTALTSLIALTVADLSVTT
jgi:hypothetical protein